MELPRPFRFELLPTTYSFTVSADVYVPLEITDALLAGIATVLGVRLALGGVSLLKHASPVAIPRLDGASVDTAVLAYALAAGIVTALLFGLVPALQARRTDVQDILKSEGIAGTSTRAHRRSRALRE